MAIKIPVIFMVAGGEAEHDLNHKMFGAKPDPEQEGHFIHNTETEIHEGVKIQYDGGYIREAEFAYQDLNTLFEIAKNYEPYIGFVAGYLASKLIDYAYAKIKIKIGKKEVSNKEEIKQALKEILDEKSKSENDSSSEDDTNDS